ncbi:hypothetical protein CQW23_34651 [Capsicum baccatum]|uniref:Protein TAR1 n=1 Tax=Capsicum baccatum TaxID=33114 RepID=A0A2G2UY98_CAPBA|nr:hypothetical protein CQW23_34651 [Capsicum baccatum]
MFFIDARAEISVAESRFHLPKKHRSPRRTPRMGREGQAIDSIIPWRFPRRGSPTETLLRLLLPLNDKVQWTSRDVAGSEPPTSTRSEHFTRSFNRQIAPPTKNGHAPPPIESRKSSQSVNPYYVWTWPARGGADGFKVSATVVCKELRTGQLGADEGPMPAASAASENPDRRSRTTISHDEARESWDARDAFRFAPRTKCEGRRAIDKTYGSILPTSLAYIVPSTRGCSPWRPNAVMSTTGCGRHSVLWIFKGRWERTGHHATCGALPEKTTLPEAPADVSGLPNIAFDRHFPVQ